MYYLSRQESSVRTTIAKRNTKALSVTDNNINSKFARGSEHSQGQQVSGADYETLGGMYLLDERFVVVNATIGGRVLF